MRWALLVATGAVLTACTIQPAAPSRILTNGNVLISTGGADDVVSPLGSSSGGSGTGSSGSASGGSGAGSGGGTGTGSSGSGGQGSGSGGQGSGTGTGTGTGAVEPGPNGSSLVPVATIEARKSQGKTYIPLTGFGDDKFNLRWTRGTFVLVPGSRPFTPNEGSMLEVAINQLNNAIGRSVFSFGGSTSGDIPVTTQDVAAGAVLGFAQFVPQVVSLEKAYVEAKVVMNVGNLARFAPDPANYQELFKTVVLHELGHIAGLGHNPQDGTLMNASTETTPILVGFAQSEIDTLRLVYAQ